MKKNFLYIMLILLILLTIKYELTLVSSEGKINEVPISKVNYSVEPPPPAIPPIQQELQDVSGKIAAMSREQIMNAKPEDFVTVNALSFAIASELNKAKRHISQEVKAYAKIHRINLDPANNYAISQVARMMDAQSPKNTIKKCNKKKQ